MTLGGRVLFLGGMAWRETDRVSERRKFVEGHRSGRLRMTELCARFGISRKTGYKLIKRFEAEGLAGLWDRSRAPRSSPNRTAPEVEGRIIELRKEYPTWGSKKILELLQQHEPTKPWPARSTIDAILKRKGLVLDRPQRRRHREPREAPVVDADCPNAVWSTDYKGWFRLGDGTRCDPLTINDVFSRYSLKCTAFHQPKWMDVKAAFEKCFREFGLPNAILSDNGTPFGSTGICGLSRLSVWFLRLGITPYYIQPGNPQQNGRHERFHSTLKRDAASPPRATVKAQQRAFDRFRTIYNAVRPHEALELRTPAELYSRSPRAYRGKPKDFEYDVDFETRRINRHGYLSWRGDHIFVGEALRQQTVALEPTDDGIWLIYLGPLALGCFDERSKKLQPGG